MSHDAHSATRTESSNAFKRVVASIDRFMVRVSAAIAVLAFLGTFLSVLAGVVSRTVYGSALVWTEELSRNLIVVSVFAGLYWVAQSGKHLAIVLPDAIVRHRVVAQIAGWSGVAISTVTSALCAIAAFDYAQGLGLRTPSLDIPLSLLFHTVAVGMLGWTLHYIVGILLGQSMVDEKPYPDVPRHEMGEVR